VPGATGAAGSGSGAGPGSPAVSGQGPGGATTGLPAPAAGTVGGISSRRTTVRRVRVSRPWLAFSGPHSRRSVRLTFWLSRAATVVVRVDQLAPECRYAGKFLVRARPGRNVVRFRGRLRGRPLEPGTYRLVAHPRAARERLVRTTLVVLDRPPGGAAEIRAARARNTCPSGRSPSQIALSASPASKAGKDAGMRARPVASKGVAGAAAALPRGGLLDVDGLIGGPLTSAADTVREAARKVPPALFAIVALAVLLLAIASMPQIGGPSRAGAMLVHKRASIATAGGAALMMAIAAYLLLVAL
jgi:hypothetical protein